MSKSARTTLADLMSGGAVFKELDENLRKLAIEGIVDELEPARRVQEAVYRQATCPRCGGTSFTKEFLGANAGGKGVTWVEGEVLPRALLRCDDCEVLFNPYTGMIVERGDQRVVPYG